MDRLLNINEYYASINEKKLINKDKVKEFMKKHWKKIVAGVGLSGLGLTVYLLYRYNKQTIPLVDIKSSPDTKLSNMMQTKITKDPSINDATGDELLTIIKDLEIHKHEISFERKQYKKALKEYQKGIQKSYIKWDKIEKNDQDYAKKKELEQLLAPKIIKRVEKDKSDDFFKKIHKLSDKNRSAREPFKGKTRDATNIMLKKGLNSEKLSTLRANGIKDFDRLESEEIETLKQAMPISEFLVYINWLKEFGSYGSIWSEFDAYDY